MMSVSENYLLRRIRVVLSQINMCPFLNQGTFVFVSTFMKQSYFNLYFSFVIVGNGCEEGIEKSIVLMPLHDERDLVSAGIVIVLYTCIYIYLPITMSVCCILNKLYISNNLQQQWNQPTKEYNKQKHKTVF